MGQRGRERLPDGSGLDVEVTVNSLRNGGACHWKVLLNVDAGLRAGLEAS